MKISHLLFPPLKKYHDQKYDYDLSFYNRRVRLFFKYAWKDSRTQLRDAEYISGLYKYHLYRFLDMVWCFFRYGCPTENYNTFEFYKLNSTYRSSFLTLRRRISLVRSDIDFDVYRSFLRKDVFNNNFKKFIHRDWILLEKESDFKKFELMLQKHTSIICKPIDDHCGNGIVKVFSSDQTGIEKIKNTVLAGVSWVCEECISNCVELQKPNPTSLNTIRINTFVDKNGNVKVFDMTLRVGAYGSVVDNLYHGGVCYPINDIGLIASYGMNTKHERYFFHPGSNYKMIGLEIPRYDELVKFISEVAAECPKARFVGWDVAITADTFELIEGNLASSEDASQLYGVGYYQFMKKNW